MLDIGNNNPKDKPGKTENLFMDIFAKNCIGHPTKTYVDRAAIF
jgi:hypothetical protein